MDIFQTCGFRYAEEVANTARYTTLITLCICGIESVFAGIIFIGVSNKYDKLICNYKKDY